MRPKAHADRPTRHTLLLITTVLLTVATASSRAFAQDTEAAQNAPQFTIKARLVVLDAVVTDAGGKPVDGLTTKDFEVYEDGKPQRIHSLEGPSFHKLPAASDAAGTSQVFNPAQTTRAMTPRCARSGHERTPQSRMYRPECPPGRGLRRARSQVRSQYTNTGREGFVTGGLSAPPCRSASSPPRFPRGRWCAACRGSVSA